MNNKNIPISKMANGNEVFYIESGGNYVVTFARRTLIGHVWYEENESIAIEVKRGFYNRHNTTYLIVRPVTANCFWKLDFSPYTLKSVSKLQDVSFDVLDTI